MASEHSASLKRIKLTLARSKNHPSGSAECGYDLIAPLDDRGHIDLATWKTHRSACTVRRFLRPRRQDGIARAQGGWCGARPLGF